jgi:hypothetical protein
MVQGTGPLVLNPRKNLKTGKSNLIVDGSVDVYGAFLKRVSPGIRTGRLFNSDLFESSTFSRRDANSNEGSSNSRDTE